LTGAMNRTLSVKFLYIDANLEFNDLVKLSILLRCCG
jgi:hypothetical protein